MSRHRTLIFAVDRAVGRPVGVVMRRWCHRAAPRSPPADDGDGESRHRRTDRAGRDQCSSRAQVLDQYGQVMAGAAVSWSSSAASVAAVNASGLVTAVANGAATITATAGSASGEAVVTVMQSAGSVVVSPAAATIALGDTVRLAAEVFDENGHLVAGAEFSWASSDVSVATVDASGLVRGAGEGTATITATAGDALGTSEITVENPDRAALVALYEATDGPNWVSNEGWLTDAPLGEWYGVDTGWSRVG